MHRTVLLSVLLCTAPSVLAAEPASSVAEYFHDDPTTQSDTVLTGEVHDRVEWAFDPPAFPGDRPGSLTALYDSRLPSGLLGIPLPATLDQDQPFTAAAIFVVEPGLIADPNAFFQISWGLWNRSTTGLNRTGSFADFAGDTFELLEFAYFPNVSPFFGGPFLTPSVFGVANTDDPSFPFLGSFVNLAFSSVQMELPAGVPLLAVLEHRPVDDVLVTSVYRVINGNKLLPVDGGVTVTPLSHLTAREYELDTLGLTLWNDGFSGEPPSLVARLTFHGLVMVPQLLERPERILHVPPHR